MAEESGGIWVLDNVDRLGPGELEYRRFRKPDLRAVRNCLILRSRRTANYGFRKQMFLNAGTARGRREPMATYRFGDELGVEQQLAGVLLFQSRKHATLISAQY